MFRGLCLIGLALFASSGASTRLHWSGVSGNLPLASPEWAGVVVNELVAPAPDQRWAVLPVLVAGAAVVVMRRDSMTRVWLVLFAVPFVILYLASLQRGVLVPRSLMPYSWAVPIVVGAVVGWVASRSRLMAGALVALLLVLVVPLVGPAMTRGDGSAVGIGSVFADARPDDGFAFEENAWQPDALLRYHAGANGRSSLAPLAGVPDGLTVLAPDGAEPTRVWFVGVGAGGLPAGVRSCGETRSLGDHLTVTCVVLPSARAAEGEDAH